LRIFLSHSNRPEDREFTENVARELDKQKPQGLKVEVLVDYAAAWT
jgi:hypothetical protein